jgi:beta-glucosidase
MDDVLTLLGQLSLEEKIGLLHGSFLSGGVPRLGIPQLLCADGPLGVRTCAEVVPLEGGANDEVQGNTALDGSKKATALPSTLALAATFNVESAREYGKVLGCESLAYGLNVIFGPGVNLLRDPRCGRNFEYMGEDPLQAGEIACAYIEGVQENGVAACAKHYYANDREKLRHFTSSNLDPVTAHEIHLRPFEMACKKAHVWTMMTGNNLVDGVHVSENPEALAIPREAWGWDGVMMTDWRAAYEPKSSIEAGLDMTTGFCSYVYGDGRLLELVRRGEVSEALIDEKVLRVLNLYRRTGVLHSEKRGPGQIGGSEHLAFASRLAAESMVLLKNDNALLPLEPATTRKLLVAGPGAKATEAGSGSSNVSNGQVDERSITVWDGLTNRYPDTELVYEPDIEKAVRLAPEMDAVLYCACSQVGGEGKELADILLPGTQNGDIAKLGAATPKLTVILQCGDVVELSSWLDAAAAVLVVWYGGQMLGEALGNVLSGELSPAGKLPCTFAKNIADFPCENLGLWPAKQIMENPPETAGFTPEERKRVYAYDANYEEGLLIGYRWFEKKNIQPLFPFGHGLSYTDFKLSAPDVTVANESLLVSCTVANTGARTGSEVVQVYLAPPASMPNRPVKELKGFAKVLLEPGESRRVRVTIPLAELAFYDLTRAGWNLLAGGYDVLIGTSSRKIDFRIKSPTTMSIVYKTVGGAELEMKLYYPPSRTAKAKKLPAVVFFFGGGWNGGSIEHFDKQATHLAQRGMIAICPQYRTKNSHGVTPDICLQDAKSAMRYVYANADRLGIDPTKIAAGGGSAGGHLAAACAFCDGFDAPGDDLSVDCKPKALLLFNPVVDFSDQGYGYDRVKEYWQAFSPMYNIGETTLPVLFQTGDKDTCVPVATAEAFKKKINENGGDCKLIIYPGMEHGFFNFGREVNRYQQTLEAMDAFLVSIGYLEVQQ